MTNFSWCYQRDLLYLIGCVETRLLEQERENVQHSWTSEIKLALSYNHREVSPSCRFSYTTKDLPCVTWCTTHPTAPARLPDHVTA